MPDAELDFSSLPRWMSSVHFYDLDKEWKTFVNYLRSPCDATLAPFIAHDLLEGFVARPGPFEQLRSAVLDSARENPVPGTTALYGPGGLGKTTLAAALCYDDDVVTCFTHGILWVTLGQQPNVQGELTKV